MFDADMIARLIAREFNPVHQDRWEGKTVMVTGAGGFIGSRLVHRLFDYGVDTVLLVEQNEHSLYEVHRKVVGNTAPILASYGDSSLMLRLIDAYKVSTVFHAGAYKHVPLVEYSPVPAVQNNVLASRQLFSFVPPEVSLVIISTDKAVNPTNIMGATKRVVELMGLQLPNTKVVRFGNVLWSTGSVLPLFYEQIKEGKNITLTHPDVRRYFMTVQEAVELTLYAGAYLPSGVFAFDMGEQVKISDLILRLFTEMGQTAEIQVTGLRPGEKMFEELSLGHDLTPTQHPKIHQANEIRYVGPEFQHTLDQLALSCALHDVGQMRNQLQKLVPTYDPSCGIVDPLWLKLNELKAKDLDDCYGFPSPVV